MEYNCEYRPLEMKFMICSSELNWVMVDIIKLHVCNCSSLKICMLTYCVNDFENGIMHFHMHWVA